MKTMGVALSVVIVLVSDIKTPDTKDSCSHAVKIAQDT